MDLIRAIDISRKEHHPCGLDGIEQGLDIGRDGWAFEAHDHQLSYLQVKVVHYDFRSFLSSCSSVSASSGVRLSTSASRSRSATFCETGVNMVNCTFEFASGKSCVRPALKRCSALSCSASTSRARVITSGGNPASLATSIP